VAAENGELSTESEIHAGLLTQVRRASSPGDTPSIGETCRAEYDVGLQRGATEANSRVVRAFFLDVTGCFAQYNVPGNGGPGSVDTRTRTWQAPWDGYLVTAVGHMHGGGIDLTLRDEASGNECTMHARYDNSEPLSGVMGIVRASAWPGRQE
jgi:hypothetical protein